MPADEANQVLRAEGISFEAMVDALRRSGAAFVGLLRSLDAADGDKPVPGLTWTVAETAVHMLTIVRRGTGDMRRSDSVPGLAVLNEQCIAETPTRHVHEVADALEQEVGRLVRGLGRMDAATAEAIPVPLHAGVVADVATALSYILFDFLAHGLDLARGAGRSWEVDPADAALDLHAVLPILEPWVRDDIRSGPSQRLAVGFPGDPQAVVVEVGEGRYRAQNEARATATAVEQVDPVEAFLAVAGREPAQSPAVARLVGWFEPI
jgi:hypothetical protein